jgi:AraC-like DNA-binding protein
LIGLVKTSSTHQPRKVSPGNHDRAEPVEIWKARIFIRTHSDEKLSLPTIAKSVHISANYLSEKFREVTGENLVRCIARTRVEKACDLLHNTDLRISEIAFAVGFQSLSQFNRAFKKLSGKSPTEYRRTLVRFIPDGYRSRVASNKNP